jgi:CBS domain-containing protein
MPTSIITPLLPMPHARDHAWRRSEFKARIGAIMTIGVLTCEPGDSLTRAAQMLWDHDCGALPVLTSDGKLVGMITSREICMAGYLQGCTQPTGVVASAMSSRVIACDVDETVEWVLELMRFHQLRRLPVVHKDGRLAGIVSSTDIARYLASLSKHDLEPFQEGRVAAELPHASICNV